MTPEIAQELYLAGEPARQRQRHKGFCTDVGRVLDRVEEAARHGKVCCNTGFVREPGRVERFLRSLGFEAFSYSDRKHVTVMWHRGLKK